MERISQEREFYFINTTLPDVARRAMRNYGWNIEDAEKRGDFFFVDACSAGIGLPGNSRY
ncbi:MAG: hypothetical protein ACXQT5_00565 [Candidatus Syntropharchaeia archaeon]